MTVNPSSASFSIASGCMDPCAINMTLSLSVGFIVGDVGVEPTVEQILSLLCLPVSPIAQGHPALPVRHTLKNRATGFEPAYWNGFRCGSWNRTERLSGYEPAELPLFYPAKVLVLAPKLVCGRDEVPIEQVAGCEPPALVLCPDLTACDLPAKLRSNSERRRSEFRAYLAYMASPYRVKLYFKKSSY